jgi:hypothetical protein
LSRHVGLESLQQLAVALSGELHGPAQRLADDAPGVEEIVKFSEEVADEDARMCEHVQRNLDAGRYDTGVLSPKWEYPLAVFHGMVRDAVSSFD